MEIKIYNTSKLVKTAVVEINAKKLPKPGSGKKLKVSIGVGLGFDDDKKDLGYELTYDLSIDCEEDGEKKLCSLKYKISAIYDINFNGKKTLSEQFHKESEFFARELYNLTRDDVNNLLYKMRILLQLPINIPKEVVENIKKEPFKAKVGKK